MHYTGVIIGHYIWIWLWNDQQQICVKVLEMFYAGKFTIYAIKPGFELWKKRTGGQQREPKLEAWKPRAGVWWSGVGFLGPAHCKDFLHFRSARWPLLVPWEPPVLTELGGSRQPPRCSTEVWEHNKNWGDWTPNPRQFKPCVKHTDQYSTNKIVWFVKPNSLVK